MIAVDALGVVLAVLANTTTLIVTVDVEGKVFVVDLLVVLALVRVTETVTSWLNEITLNLFCNDEIRIYKSAR